jgi:hypothetical protein
MNCYWVFRGCRWNRLRATYVHVNCAHVGTVIVQRKYVRMAIIPQCQALPLCRKNMWRRQFYLSVRHCHCAAKTCEDGNFTSVSGTAIVPQKHVKTAILPQCQALPLCRKNMWRWQLHIPQCQALNGWSGIPLNIFSNCSDFKGTVAPDWDELSLVWMDRTDSRVCCWWFKIFSFARPLQFKYSFFQWPYKRLTLLHITWCDCMQTFQKGS